jgi:hypothetical protein
VPDTQLPHCHAMQATNSPLPVMLFPCSYCMMCCLILWLSRPPLLRPLPCSTRSPNPTVNNPPPHLLLHRTLPLGPLPRLWCRPQASHSLDRMGSCGYPTTHSTTMKVYLHSVLTLTGYPTRAPSTDSHATLSLSSGAKLTLLPPAHQDSPPRPDMTDADTANPTTIAIHNMCTTILATLLAPVLPTPPAPALPTPPPTTTTPPPTPAHEVDDGTVHRMMGLMMRHSKHMAAMLGSSSKRAARARDVEVIS